MKDPYHIWKTAIGVTRWIGSPSSIIIHTIVFVVCFFAVAEDYVELEAMLLGLTTIVSLEAIYLAIFIQMTINYTTQELREVGEDIEEMQEDIGEIQENVGELAEEEETGEATEERRKQEQKKTLTDIQSDLRKLMQDITRLQK